MGTAYFYYYCSETREYWKSQRPLHRERFHHEHPIEKITHAKYLNYIAEYG
jgi:hypothetical protein